MEWYLKLDGCYLLVLDFGEFTLHVDYSSAVGIEVDLILILSAIMHLMSQCFVPHNLPPRYAARIPNVSANERPFNPHHQTSSLALSHTPALISSMNSCPIHPTSTPLFLQLSAQANSTLKLHSLSVRPLSNVPFSSANRSSTGVPRISFRSGIKCPLAPPSGGMTRARAARSRDLNAGRSKIQEETWVLRTLCS